MANSVDPDETDVCVDTGSIGHMPITLGDILFMSCKYVYVCRVIVSLAHIV
jgi:hypothetical protein